MSITDWHESDQRRLIAEWLDVQAQGAEWEARKARRRAKMRRCVHWCLSPWQVVSDVGRQP